MGKRIHVHDPDAGCCTPGRPPTLYAALFEYRGLVLLCNLEASNWNKAKAGRALGLTPHDMQKLCKIHNLHAPDRETLVLRVFGETKSVTRTAVQLSVGRQVVYSILRKHGRNVPTSRA